MSGGGDNTVIFWDTNTWEKTKILNNVNIGEFDISKNGNIMATAGTDKSINLWDTKAGNTTKTFRGHDAGLMRVALSPDGKYLASGSSDYKTILWNTSTGNKIHVFDDRKGYPMSFAFSPDGNTFAYGIPGSIILWDFESGEILRTLESVTSASFSQDGKLLATGGAFNVSLWQTQGLYLKKPSEKVNLKQKVNMMKG